MELIEIVASYREYAAAECAAGREPMLYSDWKTAVTLTAEPEPVE